MPPWKVLRHDDAGTDHAIPAGGKRPYRSPRLTVYGTVTRLTQTKLSVRLDAGGALTKIM